MAESVVIPRQNRNEDLYSNKIILAPMVRVSTLPMRLLALEYGADLVYCEEIIDHKLLKSQRQENELLGTTDFVLPDGTIVFRTCPQEKEKLIFQMGTSNPSKALAASKKIEDLVAGVDVNMGCPKHFSIKGGMGAALLTQPEKVTKILTTLVNGLSIPVTCKIRVLPQLEDTLTLVRLIQDTGVSAIAVHGRTKAERPGHLCRKHYIKAIAETLSIPVIANGGSKEMTSVDDIQRFKEETSTSSVMVARAAQWNVSLFRQEGPLPITTVIKQYLTKAFEWCNQEINTKFCVLQMMHDRMTEMAEGDLCLAAKTLQDFADIWGMQQEYADILKKQKEKTAELKSRMGSNASVKRRKLDNGQIYIEIPVRYDKRVYGNVMTPKQALHNWVTGDHLERLSYETVEKQRQFNSRVTMDGKVYSTPHWEKSKQTAEQGAALVCLIANGREDGKLAESETDSEELRRKWRNTLSSYTDKGDWIGDDGTNNNDNERNGENETILAETTQEITQGENIECDSSVNVLNCTR